ncbi:spermidine/putrescine ABC transporter substrate-binding protein [Bacillus sp. FJAT-29790]|uniref:ABC transporter substrate-binding protein n=1 Tax=Bacillus sp. FJAT-29790 TaxID=1895002 RepID=UPI001C24AC30|nr:spermidine/putrescine ABC transporter substrate-binding protein [Bacillus sp. FJAT-29790]MBU8879279.1 spermidine/putrescine ABC transporter substrate-binding protein [Bacillus sp. FJAT-29790]
MRVQGRFRLLFAVLLLTSVIISGCGGKSTAGDSNEKVLNIFNWAEYLPEKVIEDFEKETGIKVNYGTYSSNEEMFAKLSAGKGQYDLAVASLYYVDVLVKEGFVEEIGKQNIPNIKNIGEEFLGKDADPDDKYSIPYLWGEELIVMNTDLVKKEVTSFEDLLDPEFKNSLVVLDDPRSMLGAALAVLGYSPNSVNEKEIIEAGEWLKKLKPNIKMYDGDNAKALLASGEVKGGIVFGAEASLAIRENKAIKKIYPEEYMSLWQDNFVIPKGAKHKDNALIFIDYILRPEVSKEIVMDYPYANPNIEALKLLPENVRKEVEIPEEEVKRGIHAVDVGESTVIYDRVWAEIKQ